MHFKSIIVSILILIPGIAASAQEHQYTDHLATLLEHYIKAKDALIQHDFEDTRSYLSEFRDEVINNDEMHNHEKHSQMHAKHHSSMAEAVDKAENATDITELRSAFKDITSNLAKALENQDYSGKTLYLQYCSMAVSNKGAHWISDQEKIMNPYMGQQMP